MAVRRQFACFWLVTRPSISFSFSLSRSFTLQKEKMSDTLRKGKRNQSYRLEVQVGPIERAEAINLRVNRTFRPTQQESNERSSSQKQPRLCLLSLLRSKIQVCRRKSRSNPNKKKKKQRKKCEKAMAAKLAKHFRTIKKLKFKINTNWW